NLEGTAFPLTSTTYTINRQTFDCEGVEARNTAVTNNGTTCPDGHPGPCVGELQWFPAGATQCCDPSTDDNCHRERTGASCSTDCDCRSLLCAGRRCG